LLVFCLGPLFLFLVLLISNSYDEAAGETAGNSRGDVVKERLTVCTGVGTVINRSIVLLPLKPSFVGKTITLAEYDPVSDSSPMFQ
jgi:hypothetical protein